jgi:hypothetical protein
VATATQTETVVVGLESLCRWLERDWSLDNRFALRDEPELLNRTAIPWFGQLEPALEGIACALAGQPMALVDGIGGCRVHIFHRRGHDLGWHNEGAPDTLSSVLFLNTLGKNSGGELEVKPPKRRFVTRMSKMYSARYGDVVFFPSQWQHRVVPLKQDALRVTVACLFRPC